MPKATFSGTRNIIHGEPNHAKTTFSAQNDDDVSIRIDQTRDRNAVLSSLPKTLATLVHNIRPQQPIYINAEHEQILKVAYNILTQSFGINNDLIVLMLNDNNLSDDDEREITNSPETPLERRRREEAGRMNTVLTEYKRSQLAPRR